MVSRWWEIQVLSDPALEDLIFWRSQNFGCRGSSSQVQGTARLVKAYLPQDQVQQSDLQTLAKLLSQDATVAGFTSPTVSWQVVNEEDWANSWKQYWHPQEVGDRLLIYPAWLPLPETTDRLLLRLDPGLAFGTGAHATTQLCLAAIERQLGRETGGEIAIADIGCGTGILSIAALLLGADKTYAVDIDPLAVTSAQESRDLNRIDPSRMVVEQGSVERLGELIDAPVDGIVCNILAEVIINLIPQMSAIAKPTTWGILSGILLNQSRLVTHTLEQHGWTVSALQQQQDWCCISIQYHTKLS